MNSLFEPRGKIMRPLGQHMLCESPCICLHMNKFIVDRMNRTIYNNGNTILRSVQPRPIYHHTNNIKAYIILFYTYIIVSIIQARNQLRLQVINDLVSVSPSVFNRFKFNSILITFVILTTTNNNTRGIMILIYYLSTIS